MHNLDLFQQLASKNHLLYTEEICEGALILRNFCTDEALFWHLINELSSRSPFRHMMTAGGFKMSVATTSCGSYGWVSDVKGYRYTKTDPLTGELWPSMPDGFLELAIKAATHAGFPHFVPDSCLINRYELGARLSLHQDKDEKILNDPIVSVSLGLPATFLFGGLNRRDKTQKILLNSQDVVVWGGPARLKFHGILPLKKGMHSIFGPYRFNLTFRNAQS